MGKFVETEGKIVVTRGLGSGKLVFSGYGVSFWGDEKVLGNG